MTEGPSPTATFPWRAGAAAASVLLLAGGLLDQGALIWAGIAVAYIGLLLARNERIINPESWASASDLKLAYVARGVIAVFAVAALASVAAGLEARWIALAAGVLVLGLIGLSQFAEDGGGFLATTRGKSSRALAIAYAVALIAFAAIVLVRI